MADARLAPLASLVLLVAPALGCSSRATAAPSGATEHATGPSASAAVIRCGAAQCVVGREVCCSSGDGASCVALPEPGTADAADTFEAVRAQGDGLRAACGEPELAATLCDESADCAGGRVCCFVETGFVDSSSVGFVACASPESCVEPERCASDGAPCADGESVCVAGACRRPASMRCGEASCSATAPYCCVALGGEAAPFCGTADACAAQERVAHACLHSGHCAPGDHCQRPIMAPGGWCVRRLDVANMATLCEEAAHCADTCAGAATPGAPSCNDDRTCACE